MRKRRRMIRARRRRFSRKLTMMRRPPVEKKYVYFQWLGDEIGNTNLTFTPYQNIAQGTSQVGRVGVSIFVRYVYLRLWMRTQETTATQLKYQVRVFMLNWPNGSADASVIQPQDTTVDTTLPLYEAPFRLSRDPGRFRIIFDKYRQMIPVTWVDTATSTVHMPGKGTSLWMMKKKYRINKTIQFVGGTGSTARLTNELTITFVSDQAAAQDPPQIFGFMKVAYLDA